MRQQAQSCQQAGGEIALRGRCESLYYAVFKLLGDANLSGQLVKSTAVVGAMTLVSRILGFVRDMVIARHFGADAATDAFFVAFRIPNFLRRLFAEGSFAQAFVPMIAECREQTGEAGLKAFLARASGSLALLVLLASALGSLLAPLLILLFAPGFYGQDAQFGLSSAMLRVTFPYLFFVTLVAFAGGVLNAYGRFAIPALTPALLNMAMIAAVLWLAPQMAEPAMALAWGVLLAGAAQLALQIPALLAAGLLPRPRIALADPQVQRLLRRMAPAIFGVSVTPVNLLVNTLMASFLMSGSVSWLYYSDRLVEFPLGVFGIAMSTAILPHLSKSHALQDVAGFARALDWGLRWVLLIGLPATVGLAVLAEPLMSTLFQYDEFGSRDVLMAGRSLMTYSAGLVGFIAVKILASGFNARHDFATPVRCGFYAMGANLALGLVLAVALARWGWGHAGLALATALAAWVNAGLLLRGLLHCGVFAPEAGWAGYLLRLAWGNLAMGWLLVQFAVPLPWPEWSSRQRIIQLALWIAAGGAAYFAALALAGLRPSHLRLRGAA